MSKLTIVEVLDFGQSLLSNGSILKADGTIITKEQYEANQQSAQRNKLDWFSVEVDEFINYLDTAIFATKTYDSKEQVNLYQNKDSAMHNSLREHKDTGTHKMSFVILDSEGEPFYLRSQEFSGAEKYEMAEATYSKLLYNITKNSTEDVFDILSNTLEEHFNVKEQVGSMFSPDEGTTYNIKKFIKDNHVWSMIFKDGTLSNIKQGERLHQEAEVRPKPSKLGDAINSNRFQNMH